MVHAAARRPRLHQLAHLPDAAANIAHVEADAGDGGRPEMLAGREGQDEAVRHDPFLVRTDRHEHLWVLGERNKLRLGHHVTPTVFDLPMMRLGALSAKTATICASPVTGDRMRSR
jgi:hypothetical protein